MSEMKISRVCVSPVAPFDFELTSGYLTYFQSRYGTDSLDQGVYRRLLDLDGRLVLASVRSVGSVDSPRLLMEFEGDNLGSAVTDAAAARVGWLLGVEQDLAPFYRLAQQDPTMAALVDRFRGLHLPHTASVFEALILGILGQQISTSVARVLRTLLIETYGPKAEFNGETCYAFPRPESLAAASVEELRGLKLSKSKAEYVQGVAAETLISPDLSLDRLGGLEDEDLVRRVVQLRGVGRWTAQWLLIRAMGRPDALPLGDLALRRVVSQLYFGNNPIDDKQVEEFCRQWSPWRSYATVYWFTALRLGPG